MGDNQRLLQYIYTKIQQFKDALACEGVASTPQIRQRKEMLSLDKNWCLSVQCKGNFMPTDDGKRKKLA